LRLLVWLRQRWHWHEAAEVAEAEVATGVEAVWAAVATGVEAAAWAAVATGEASEAAIAVAASPAACVVVASTAAASMVEWLADFVMVVSMVATSLVDFMMVEDSTIEMDSMIVMVVDFTIATSGTASDSASTRMATMTTTPMTIRMPTAIHTMTTAVVM
jgi:hypothetical protein